MSSVRKCAIYGCRSNSRDNKDLKLFNFPARDSYWYSTWLTICHESAEVLRTKRQPYICSKHFNPGHVGPTRLATWAVPSLLLTAPHGFAEEERIRKAELADSHNKKVQLLELINDCVFEYIKRAVKHPEISSALVTSRHEIQRVAKEIRNLLCTTLMFSMDDNWLRKFRLTYLRNWDITNDEDSDEKQIIQTLDLVEIIKSFDADAKISSEEEISKLVEEDEKKLQIKKLAIKKKQLEHCPPLSYNHINSSPHSKKKSFTETLETYYGIDSKKNTNTELNSKKMDSVDLCEHDDECFDISSESEDCGSPVEVMPVSEPILETYQQALDHLKPLEDFALRRENYRVIGLLSTLENIFKELIT